MQNYTLAPKFVKKKLSEKNIMLREFPRKRAKCLRNRSGPNLFNYWIYLKVGAVSFGLVLCVISRYAFCRFVGIFRSPKVYHLNMILSVSRIKREVLRSSPFPLHLDDIHVTLGYHKHIHIYPSRAMGFQIGKILSLFGILKAPPGH
jgi:hypothetical protein